jgi:hypothetical protein
MIQIYGFEEENEDTTNAESSQEKGEIHQNEAKPKTA